MEDVDPALNNIKVALSWLGFTPDYRKLGGKK